MARPNLTSRVAKALWDRRNPQWAEGHPDRVDPRLELTPGAVPRYVADRVAVKVRDKVKGRQPWITRDALDLLDGLLHSTDHGVEYGAGGTTAWFAERVEFMDSVEGFAQWYEPLRKDLSARGVTNVDLHLVSAEELGYETDAHRDAYVGIHPELGPESVDFVFVDGEYRDACAMRGVELLRPGGLLILDNADIYIPSQSRSPHRLDEPSTPLWAEVLDRVASWRQIWTTNGVWDTVIWVKP